MEICNLETVKLILARIVYNKKPIPNKTNIQPHIARGWRQILRYALILLLFKLILLYGVDDDDDDDDDKLSEIIQKIFLPD